jgi:hypothetical protein
MSEGHRDFSQGAPQPAALKNSSSLVKRRSGKNQKTAAVFDGIHEPRVKRICKKALAAEMPRELKYAVTEGLTISWTIKHLKSLESVRNNGK